MFSSALSRVQMSFVSVARRCEPHEYYSIRRETMLTSQKLDFNFGARAGFYIRQVFAWRLSVNDFLVKKNE